MSILIDKGFESLCGGIPEASRLFVNLCNYLYKEIPEAFREGLILTPLGIKLRDKFFLQPVWNFNNNVKGNYKYRKKVNLWITFLHTEEASSSKLIFHYIHNKHVRSYSDNLYIPVLSEKIIDMVLEDKSIETFDTGYSSPLLFFPIEYNNIRSIKRYMSI